MFIIKRLGNDEFIRANATGGWWGPRKEARRFTSRFDAWEFARCYIEDECEIEEVGA